MTKDNMTKERYNELNNDIGEPLSKKELDDGYHFCIEWDDLLIHESSPEYECCNCYYKELRESNNG